MRSSLLFDEDLESPLRTAGVRTAADLLALGDAAEPRRYVGPVELTLADGARRFYLKRYRYAGWRESRGLLGRGTLWGMPPELREFRNLALLRAHGIPAVRPVAACAVWRHGRLVAHALLTEAVEEATDLQARLDTPGDPLLTSAESRRALMRGLGAALRRMHGLPFVHRDLRARNVLVRRKAGVPAFWLLDCRRGGARGEAAADLAALDRDLKGVLSRGDRYAALQAYLGAAGGAKPLVTRIAARRATLPPPRKH